MLVNDCKFVFGCVVRYSFYNDYGIWI
jgi:hypothetical protein